VTRARRPITGATGWSPAHGPRQRYSARVYLVFAKPFERTSKPLFGVFIIAAAAVWSVAA